MNQVKIREITKNQEEGMPDEIMCILETDLEHPYKDWEQVKILSEALDELFPQILELRPGETEETIGFSYDFDQDGRLSFTAYPFISWSDNRQDESRGGVRLEVFLNGIRD